MWLLVIAMIIKANQSKDTASDIWELLLLMDMGSTGGGGIFMEANKHICPTLEGSPKLQSLDYNQIINQN